MENYSAICFLPFVKRLPELIEKNDATFSAAKTRFLAYSMFIFDLGYLERDHLVQIEKLLFKNDSEYNNTAFRQTLSRMCRNGDLETVEIADHVLYRLTESGLCKMFYLGSVLLREFSVSVPQDVEEFMITTFGGSAVTGDSSLKDFYERYQSRSLDATTHPYSTEVIARVVDIAFHVSSIRALFTPATSFENACTQKIESYKDDSKDMEKRNSFKLNIHGHPFSIFDLSDYYGHGNPITKILSVVKDVEESSVLFLLGSTYVDSLERPYYAYDMPDVLVDQAMLQLRSLLVVSQMFGGISISYKLFYEKLACFLPTDKHDEVWFQVLEYITKFFDGSSFNVQELPLEKQGQFSVTDLLGILTDVESVSYSILRSYIASLLYYKECEDACSSIETIISESIRCGRPHEWFYDKDVLISSISDIDMKIQLSNPCDSYARILPQLIRNIGIPYDGLSPLRKKAHSIVLASSLNIPLIFPHAVACGDYSVAFENISVNLAGYMRVKHYLHMPDAYDPKTILVALVQDDHRLVDGLKLADSELFHEWSTRASGTELTLSRLVKSVCSQYDTTDSEPLYWNMKTNGRILVFMTYGEFSNAFHKCVYPWLVHDGRQIPLSFLLNDK